MNKIAKKYNDTGTIRWRGIKNFPWQMSVCSWLEFCNDTKRKQNDHFLGLLIDLKYLLLIMLQQPILVASKITKDKLMNQPLPLFYLWLCFFHHRNMHLTMLLPDFE